MVSDELNADDLQVISVNFVVFLPNLFYLILSISYAIVEIYIMLFA